MKKIIYIAHPISGDIENNLKDIIRILRIINTNSHPNKGKTVATLEEIVGFGNCVKRDFEYLHFDFSFIVPVCPYYADILALDDTKPEERARGIANDTALIKSRVFDEIWLTGYKISYGMQCEIDLANRLSIPVINYINKF